MKLVMKKIVLNYIRNEEHVVENLKTFVLQVALNFEIYRRSVQTNKKTIHMPVTHTRRIK
jgi:hypothetical protein